jgi:FKBP-type peptidyl-prolyl cis-trans isomerase
LGLSDVKRGRGGVRIEDLAAGSGPEAVTGCTVHVRYDLFLSRGDQLQRDQEHSFRLGARRVIPGLEYGVDGMRVGGQRRIVVGPHLAYREAGVPGVVPPNAVLEFRVTLLELQLPAQNGA